jgi:hypothetical protein
MLKNSTYLGILRSGESQSEIFKKLQIIDEDTFQRAQEIMKQQTMKHSDVPLNSKGNALLAGKVFCGHCGSKLVLTTSGKNHCRADGTFVKKIRLRYQCHYKVRHPQLCDGQSGYGVTTLDGIVERAIHQLFDRIKTIPEDDMIQNQMRKQEADCKAQLTRTKILCNRREKELSDYQSEVLKVIRGESQLSTTVINELIEKAEGTLQEAQKDEAHWAEELDSIQQKATDMHKLYGKVVSWSELFDTCNMAEKKMIVFQLIRQVRVWKDYRIEIDFNVNVEQLLTYQQPPLSA